MKVFNYLFMFVILIGVTSCSMKKNVRYSSEFTIADSAKVKSLNMGETFAIKLDFQPGTGYLWVLEEVSQNLELVKQVTYGSSEDGEKTGGFEKQLFVFRAEKEGKAKIEIQYKRVWDKKKKPAKIYKLNLNVLKKI